MKHLYQQNARHRSSVVSTNDAAVNIFGASLGVLGYPRRHYWIKGIIAKSGTLGSIDMNLTKAHDTCCQIALYESCSTLSIIIFYFHVCKFGLTVKLMCLKSLVVLTLKNLFIMRLHLLVCCVYSPSELSHGVRSVFIP